MKTRSISLVLALGLFALAIWFAFKPRPEPITFSTETSSAGGPVATVPPSPAATLFRPQPLPSVPRLPSVAPTSPTPEVADSPLPVVSIPGASPNESAAAASAATSRDARIDEEKVRLMLRDYRTLTGGNPVGTNAEIMQALMGGNPKQATLGPPEGMSLNGAGELVDQWNTPYFFHQISREVTEVRSAGPDKRLWTADDVVAR